MDTPSTPDHIYLLDKLAGRINQHHEQALYLLQTAKDKVLEAAAEMQLCGQALSEVKQDLPWGKWKHWVRKHCAFSEVTAWRYIRFAILSRVKELDFSTARSITDLYRIAGMMPEPESGPEAAAPPPLTFPKVQRWISSFRSRITGAPILTWPQEEQAQLKAELQPLAELYARL
jgi:hypothetical protein